MKNEEFYREACRRKNRLLGHYLAIQAWLCKLDCIVLDRRVLERFLKLKRFKGTRVKWLIADLKPWFPFHSVFWMQNADSSIHSLYLSRVEIEPHLPTETMTTELRIARMASGAPRTETFPPKSKTAPPSEEDMIAELALVTAGLQSPEIFPAY